jgi:LPXTG-site transpeptidase (sortase) family protein
MYLRGTRHTGRMIALVVIIGIAAGAVYFAQDNPVTVVTPTPVPVNPTMTALAPEPTPLPQVEISRLFIPSLGVQTPVIEIFRHNHAWDLSFLGNNAGHLEGTAGLEETGNIVLAGHVERADGTRGVFAEIGNLARRELIILQLPAEERRYHVTEVRAAEPGELSVLYPTETDRITLITCSDYDFLQGTYLSRVVVIAERV